jgi:hypothetical protein
MASIRTVIAAVALAIAAAASAGAQDQPPPMGSMMMEGGPHAMMGAGGMGHGMMMGGPGQGMCMAMAGHIDGRLAYIKAELKITEAQEALWKSYAAVARENANAMLGRCNKMMGPGGTAAASLPERLDEHEQLMAAHLDAVRALDKALKPLYAALSDSQKQTADQLFWGPMGM